MKRRPIFSGSLNDFIRYKLPSKLHPLISDDASKGFLNIQNLIKHLPHYLPTEAIVEHEDDFEVLFHSWVDVAVTVARSISTVPSSGLSKYGLAFQVQSQGIELLQCLLNRMYEAQAGSDRFVPRKGFVHYWMSDIYREMNFPVHAKRYMMLALIEDAMHQWGNTSGAGSRYRLKWEHGLSEALIDKYSTIAADRRRIEERFAYPESVLLEVGTDWITELPSPDEALHYKANHHFLRYLRNRLKDGTGKALEKIAHYLLLCMPGCRTTERLRTTNLSDIDFVASVDGFEVDFRSELGRYFVGECKDKVGRMDYGEVAKFCQVLASVKSRFGIIFSPMGISGEDSSDPKAASRELLKVYQNTGTVIVVIKDEDLDNIEAGGNFISILHDKYEKGRLDLKEAEGKKSSLFDFYTPSKSPVS